MPQVGIIMGSHSDLPRMRKVGEILDLLGIEYEACISSAHRTPEKTKAWATGASERGVEVIIAGAGGSAALPGVIAAYTLLPVIGVPVKAWATDGLDSLLSIAQMPKGVPVATVAIDGTENAALLAARILALKSPSIRQALTDYLAQQADVVEGKDAELQRVGLTGSDSQ